MEKQSMAQLATRTITMQLNECSHVLIPSYNHSHSKHESCYHSSNPFDHHGGTIPPLVGTAHDHSLVVGHKLPIAYEFHHFDDTYDNTSYNGQLTHNLDELGEEVGHDYLEIISDHELSSLSPSLDCITESLMIQSTASGSVTPVSSLNHTFDDDLSEHNWCHLVQPINDKDMLSPPQQQSCTSRNASKAPSIRIPKKLKKERGPKLAFKMEIDVDVIDDGYKWRKYGQKAAKNNPYPRGYYKCTSKHCNVKKHVERQLHEPKFVITTYEGVHNHLPPDQQIERNHVPTRIHHPLNTSNYMDYLLKNMRHSPPMGSIYNPSINIPQSS